MMKILLVEPSEAIRQIHRTVLSALGEVEFVDAADGLEALARAQVDEFDLVLIEANLPGLDGLSLARQIRQTDRSTPLAMVTSECEKEHVVDAIRAGVNAYVVKPFTPELLLEKLRAALDRCKQAA